jgi:protein phosphatase
MEFAGETHIGLKRRKNEDRYLISSLGEDAVLLAVADGMGGNPGGDKAAQLVVDTLAAFRLSAAAAPAQEALAQTLLSANSALLALAEKTPDMAGMGTTATAALLYESRVHWAHVGDSRLYRLRQGQLTQITTDHTFLRELVEHGDMTAAEAATHPLRNMLDQCVGCEDCLPEHGVFRLEPDDRLLLCSDGLHRELSAQQITTLLSQGEHSAEIVRIMVQTALENGGRDNVTVVAGLRKMHPPMG